ncbi:MAG TPA: 3-hydroxylacyl-ACP dehydratase [bacterium]|jgi:predicted hotdog family 3-hydroxylacyl-ACP dehydratase|nr:3-hydroxylacyl-ACP dehydratase [bacterium]
MSDLRAICAAGIERLLPHRPPMVLLDRALGLDGDWFEAEVDVEASSPLHQDGGVPAYVGIEYMAQAVAAYAGAEGLEHGGAVKVGMLLGSRDYQCRLPTFATGMRLKVRVRKALYQAGGISAMDCLVLDAATGQQLASAQLTVVQVDDVASLGDGA